MTCIECNKLDLRGREGILTLCESCYELALKKLEADPRYRAANKKIERLLQEVVRPRTLVKR